MHLGELLEKGQLKEKCSEVLVVPTAPSLSPVSMSPLLRGARA